MQNTTDEKVFLLLMARTLLESCSPLLCQLCVDLSVPDAVKKRLRAGAIESKDFSGFPEKLKLFNPSAWRAWKYGVQQLAMAEPAVDGMEWEQQLGELEGRPWKRLNIVLKKVEMRVMKTNDPSRLVVATRPARFDTIWWRRGTES